VSYTYDYPRPALTVDCVVFGLDEQDLPRLVTPLQSPERGIVDPFRRDMLRLAVCHARGFYIRSAFTRAPAITTMRDITNPKLLYAKGILFLAAGLLAAALLLLEHPTLKTGVLLALSVWCFARAYYFAFYVIERYIDPTYRHAGLWSALRHLLRRRQR
jgi:hypothetical protein